MTEPVRGEGVKVNYGFCYYRKLFLCRETAQYTFTPSLLFHYEREKAQKRLKQWQKWSKVTVVEIYP